MAHIAHHLSVAELGRRARTSDDACAARHYQAIWLLAQGKPLAEVAATTGFVQRWLEQLVSRYNQFGPDALGDRRRRTGTAPRLLTPDLVDNLRVHLAGPPPDGGTWSTPKIAAWMAAELGLVSVYPQRAWEALHAIGRSIQAPRPRNPAAAGPEAQAAFKKRAATLAEEEARHPGRPVALFCTDEHRIGLKPITRRVWAPRGRRPTALGHHRYEWLYVTAFVAPAIGESHWYVGNGVSKPLFEGLLALFAREAGAGERPTVILLLDGAGWHTEPGLRVREGLRLIYLPPYTLELQPAEHLWRLVDEPIANRHFDRLADIQGRIEQRCRDLEADPHTLRANTLFPYWPQHSMPN